MTISSEALQLLLQADLKDQDLPFEGILAPEMSSKEAAAVSIVKSLTSKWEVANTQKADDAALEKFIAANTKCGEWALPDVIGLPPIDVRTEMLLNDLKKIILDFWLPWGFPLVDHPNDVLKCARVGPGSAIGARGESFYAKLFASPMTCTSAKLYHWYRHYTDKFPYWNEAEMFRVNQFGEPQIVVGSRLSFVPKNVEISRCICTEPSLNAFFQIGFSMHLESRLREQFGIALHDQQFKNRDLARLGSITDGLATLDLSSASDTISCKMLKWLLPSDFYRWLDTLRSPVVEIPGRGTAELNMISSMGNGFTFPLETLIFTAVVAAALKQKGIPLVARQSSELWGVFGDDIICPESCTRDVIHLLTLLGFEVNGDKSFVKGPFRESCGSDFFNGADIRGIYLKDLSTQTQRYSAINQLVRFSTKTGIALPKLVGRLLETVDFLPVPRWANIDSGIHLPLSLCPNLRRDGDTQSIFFNAWVPITKYIRFNDWEVVVPRRNKSLQYNPSGLLISVLQGGASSQKVSVRNDRVRYVKKRLISPNWDWCPSPDRDRFDYGLDWSRWESVLEDLVTGRHYPG